MTYSDDSYKTINKQSEALLKEKGSKFIAHVFPVSSEEEVKDKQQDLRLQYKDAGHHCYAFRLGADGGQYRYSDDGEPGGSAGSPIYGQLLSFEVTNCLAVVVRYFGGTKLGVGGLISAYKEATREALDASEIITKHVENHYKVAFTYDRMNDVMRVVKEFDLEIRNQMFESTCELEFGVRLAQTDAVMSRLKNFQLDANYLRTV